MDHSDWPRVPMHARFRAVLAMVAYQSTVALALLLFPVALVLRRTVGVRLPLDRVIDRALAAHGPDSADAA